MFKRIDHIEINTADFQGTIDFYQRVFGSRPGLSSTSRRLKQI